MFDDRRVDTGGVDDRRGRRGGLPIAIGGGGGIAALVLYLVVTLLGGGDGSSLVPAEVGTGAGAGTADDLRARCNTDGAIERYDDCYVIKSYNEVNEVWEANLSGYRAPRLVFFEQATSTACGSATSSVGPFYCPADASVYFDLGFLAELQRRFGAEGRYAQTYIVAHEVGHHIQAMRGTMQRVQSARGDQQQLAIGLELQADCLAGAWSALANRAGNVTITERELDQALGAAAAVGDDRIQERTQGRVDPEQWTHGSAAQRRDAFLAGYTSADAARCDALLPLR
jgi:predicted metalloprotease